MEKEVLKRKVNDDFIPVLCKDGRILKYLEKYIEKNHQDIISKIETLLDNEDISLLDIQNLFSAFFPGTPIGYSYCLPYEYDSAFVDSANYPKIYTQEEYDLEIHNVRTDFINKEKEKLDKEKERNQIEDNLYQESLERIKNDAEEKVKSHIAEIRSSFVKKAIRYIQAHEFYTALKKIKADETNVMYSTEIIGWTKFNFTINENVKIHFKSNFCYGRSAYFHISLIYKDVEILSYPKLVQYYYANMYDFIDCTESYKPERKNWIKALSFVAEQANWVVTDEDAFVQKWIIDGTNTMVQGLKDILNNPNIVLDRLIKSNLDDTSLYAVRNVTKDEIAEYKIYRDEMTIAFQAEKISGSLLLIPNLIKLSSLYIAINTIIEEIEHINKVFFPELHNAIVFLSDRIKTLSDRINIIQVEYQTFKRTHYKELKDYDIFKVKNQDNINVLEDYIKLHPEFEIIYNEKNRYEKEIKELTEELNRLMKFKRQLSRCAQLICDYGLASCDNYLSTDYNKAQELLSVSDGPFVISKDKKRLFKYKTALQTKSVLLPDTIKVICDSAFSNNNIIERIKLPINLKSIGSCGFQSCYNLQEIVLPNSLEEIGTDNFFACRSLKRVVLSRSMKEIPSWSFNNCSSLSQLVIPPSIKKIGNGAFKGCSSLSSIHLPSSVEEVGENIFAECKNLKAIYVSNSSISRFEKLLGQYKEKLVGVN